MKGLETINLKGNRYKLAKGGKALYSYNILAIVICNDKIYVNTEIINLSATTNNHFKHSLGLGGNEGKEFKERKNKDFIYVKEDILLEKFNKIKVEEE